MDLESGSSIESCDYHTAGEPFRIVDAGPMEGSTVIERRSWAEENLDDLRKFLVHEPRGHADMYGGFIVPPDDSGGDLGVVFFHSDGFSTACGHGTIALVTWAIDSGFIKSKADHLEVVIDVPSGRLFTKAKILNGKVESVTFINVPSFVSAKEVKIDTAFGPIILDVSFGGAFYASIETNQLGLNTNSKDLNKLIEISKEIKSKTQNLKLAEHPSDRRLSGIYGSIFYETLEEKPLRQSNITIFADGQVDRSPCGSGTSARLALLHEKNLIKTNEPFFNHGIAGGMFKGQVIETKETGIITSIEGSAYCCSKSSFYLDPRDPIGMGFKLK